MKTPADDPILSEYLPALSILLHLAGARINPDLSAPEIDLLLTDPFLDLAAEFFPDFGILSVSNFKSYNFKFKLFPTFHSL